MRLKPKGRKIYRKKTKFERMQALKSNTAAIAGTLLVVVILLFVGFSIGGPVLSFLQDSHILAVPNEVEETVPPTEVTEPAASEAETEAVTEPPTDPKPEIPKIQGCLLEPSAMVTQTALETALSQIPEGITHVLVPLKAKGGGLYFAASMSYASKGGIVQAAVPLTSIYQTVSDKGYTPVAVINTLEDSLYPQAYADAAYHCEDGSVWLDSSNAPQLSPFSDLALDYLGTVAGEIYEAGFRSIVCDGLSFPAFSEADAARIESRAVQEGRYTALTNVIERMQQDAPHTDFYVLMSGNAVLMNQNETLSATESLRLTSLIMKVDQVSGAHIDTLRSLPEKNAALFLWDGAAVPDEEHSFIIPLPESAESQETEDAS